MILERAGSADIDSLSHVIAEAFHPLAVSRWLLPGANARREIFPAYFRLHVEAAVTHGLVLTTPGRDAAALWLPIGPDGPEPASAGYRERLAAITGPHLDRFTALDDAFERHHPAGVAHEHLAILAVRPRRQRRGIGTALLGARHTALDRHRLPAYLEASDARKRGIYLRHGYVDHGQPLRLPDGPVMYPMWRDPKGGSL
jgi:GNAT superfamily N-acetyltransferase